ncbi:hypothetical protein ANCCAN_15955 [Ancylostoma caninum]|uniref:Uncharacterized protein n=1 Tax=Ancylostoma caninum TaxID=29170 RepID=A0A368G638_ANCCA|nr:hypothetical protein ANCCAN_15955 [Ancylostoma caninum]
MSVQFTIAGTGPVEDKSNKKIFNYNLSHIVKGHLDYSRKLSEVLAAVGVAVKSLSPDDLSQENMREAIGEAEDALTISVPAGDDLKEDSSCDVENDMNAIREISIKDKETAMN